MRAKGDLPLEPNDVTKEPTPGDEPAASASARPGSGQPRPTRPRYARVLTKAQFDAVFAANIRLHSTHFRVHLRADTGEPARLGLAIAKRAAKRSVDRNRIKRHVREAFRHARHALAGFDFVVQAKDTALDVDGNALQREITELFDKARQRRFRAPPPVVPGQAQS